ncbi:MAG: SDR family NAD(P)-dependent oxidoreductase [Rhodobacterales bacterium]|nr:SDR family NAD(P)-dependent oxidoreductase [Rhodobacterales bacterium]
MWLDENVVIVTGASRGIGAAAAQAFAENGARVVLLARDSAAMRELATGIGPRAVAIPCDVTDFLQVQTAVDATLRHFGRIDVMVNNAGVMGPMEPMATADPSDWDQTIDINLKGVFYCIRAVLPPMLGRGGGTIISVSSGAAFRPTFGWSAYCASKAGAAMLTQNLHLEYAAQGIRCFGLSPGTVATDMQRTIRESGVGPIAALDWSVHIPPEWPARALVWLCTKDADDLAGTEVSLREEAIRRRVGLVR